MKILCFLPRSRKRYNVVSRYYFITVFLTLLCGLLCLFVQPAVYAPIHNSVSEYFNQRTMPPRIVGIMSAENASRILDEEIDSFRAKNRSRIPKIIHQIYANDMIPDVYVPYIKSWVANHPDYEYWLWDDISARALVEKHYPLFLPLFDSYCFDLFRSDATRYFLLHRYGGMYMDMDYISYKRIDPLLGSTQCLVVEENRPQSRMIYRVPDMIMNAWMASVPNHPYIHYLINLLPSMASCHFSDVLASTGPIFIYKARKQYLKITRCNQLEGCFVHVLSSDKMMRSSDPEAVRAARQSCQKSTRLTRLQMEACKLLSKENFSTERAKSGDAYADHFFLHLGNDAKNYQAMKRFNIKDIVPHVVIPSERKI